MGYLGGTLRNLLQDIRDRRRSLAPLRPNRPQLSGGGIKIPAASRCCYKVANGELTFRDYCRILTRSLQRN